MALELVGLGLRWIHVVAALLWVGGTLSLAWIPGRPSPDQEPWLRWGAMATVGAGAALLFLVYYHPQAPYLLEGGAAPPADRWMPAFFSLVLGGGAGALLARFGPPWGPLADAALAASTLALVWGLDARLGFSLRATYVHAGAFLASAMAGGLWVGLGPALTAEVEAQVRHHARRAAAPAVAVVLFMLGSGQPVLFTFGPLETTAATLAVAHVAAVVLGRLRDRTP